MREGEWTWKVKVAEDDPGFWVGSAEQLISVIVGILMGAGLDSRGADPIARIAWTSARKQIGRRISKWSEPPWSYSISLSDGRSVSITSNDLPEDPNRYCDGIAESGGRCPRHLNHLGGC